MQWNGSLSVGVDLIDTQHQELFRRIDSFYDAMKAGRGQDEVLEVLDFMLNYTVTHFTAEEGIQRKYNYPKYPAHKQLHTGFIADIQSMKNDIIKNGVTIASGAMVGMALSNWLVTHINVEDKALGAYIRSVDAGK